MSSRSPGPSGMAITSTWAGIPSVGQMIIRAVATEKATISTDTVTRSLRSQRFFEPFNFTRDPLP